MPARALPGIGLQSEWDLGENLWKEGMDANLSKLDTLIATEVESIGPDLPVSPANGLFFIPTSGPNANNIAVRDQGVWKLYPAKRGQRAWDKATNQIMEFNGSIWRYPFGELDAAVIIATEKAAEAVEAAENALTRDPLERVRHVATRAAMKALDTTQEKVVYSYEGGGRAGRFLWKTGDYAARIAADLSEAIYIKANAIAATAGAWVRDYTGPVMATWWGMDTTGATDCGNLISRIFAMVEIQWIHFPAGHYRITNSPTCNHHIRLTGDGFATHLDFSAGSALMMLYGTVSSLPNLSAYMRTERDFASFGAAHNMQPDDLFLAFDPAEDSFFDGGPSRNYKQAEFFVVHRVVNATDVKIFGRPHALFLSGSATIMLKVNAIRVEMSGFRVSEGSAGSAIRTRWGRAIRVRDISVKASFYSGLEFDRCYDGVIQGVSISNAANTSDMYGLSLNSCTDFTVDGGSPSAGRHSIALGQWYEEGAGPNRNIRLINMTLRNASNSIGAADMHGCVDGVTYENCVMEGGAILAGRNVTYRNCEINQTPGDARGYCFYGSETCGGVYTLENCVLRVHDADLTSGAIYLVPGRLRQGLLLVVRNISVKDQLGYDGTSANARILYIEGNNPGYPVNVLVDGLVAELNRVDFVLTATETSPGNFLSDYLAVDNVTIKAAGGRMLIQNAGKIANVKTRENGTTKLGGGTSLSWP